MKNMRTLITYGSQYGSTKQYAESFAALTGFPVLPYSEVQAIAAYDCVIHFGALYAGGVLGLKHIIPLLSEQTKFVIVTVGLADIQDAENIQNIRRSIRSQVPEDVWNRTAIFHLRGAIDYNRLNFKHRTMMTLLYAKAKGLPEEKKNAETRAMIETFGKQVSFVNEAALHQLKNEIFQIEST